jgi:hypothetical protein
MTEIFKYLSPWAPPFSDAVDNPNRPGLIQRRQWYHNIPHASIYKDPSINLWDCTRGYALGQYETIEEMIKEYDEDLINRGYVFLTAEQWEKIKILL